jgi:hypothetical protein
VQVSTSGPQVALVRKPLVRVSTSGRQAALVSKPLAHRINGRPHLDEQRSCALHGQ